MDAQLIAITKPVHPDCVDMDPEEFIAYCARVSNPSNQMNNETSGKLLLYCLKRGHWSVFEQVDVTMKIVTSRAIAAQILRHKSFSFQEFSQRYAEATELENIDPRLKHGGNRQGSGDDVDEHTYAYSNAMANYAMEAYKLLLSQGVAPESARFNLPLCTQTTLYMKGSVRSWITYFWQRLDPHAQKEHRELAGEMLRQFAPSFPLIYECVVTSRPQVIEGPWIAPEGQFSTGFQGEVLD